MNALEIYLKQECISESDAMDLLQQHGIISDNCIWAREAANAEEAVAFLRGNPLPEHPA